MGTSFFEKENSILKLAPIVLFVYNRPWHTQQTVEALQKNDLADESDLFIFSDAAKNDTSIEKVQEVRDYIRTIKGFKNITIIERDTNFGLANSIIDGVTRIVQEYGKIIVLEDDLISSSSFLRFMNEALELYKDEEKVFSITGYSFTDNIIDIDNTYFLKLVSSWSWATWNNKWDKFHIQADNLTNLLNNKKLYKTFNYDNTYNYILMAKNQLLGKNHSWAIHWYWYVFQQNGLTLFPAKRLIQNIGHDGSGTNCGKGNIEKPLSAYHPFFTKDLFEKSYIRTIIKNLLYKQHKSLFARSIKKIKYLKNNLFYRR